MQCSSLYASMKGANEPLNARSAAVEVIWGGLKSLGGGVTFHYRSTVKRLNSHRGGREANDYVLLMIEAGLHADLQE